MEPSLTRRRSPLSQLKHKIHNTRIPIRDKRLLFAVKCVYFMTPIVLGCLIMEWVKPDPEELRRKLRPSELAEAMTERNKRGMAEALGAAEAAARRRQQQQERPAAG